MKMSSGKSLSMWHKTPQKQLEKMLEMVILHQTSIEATTRDAGNGNIEARNFTFRKLAAATKNFRSECLLGEGGFGRVYKGRLENLGQVVAVKQLDRNGFQGNKEFIVEVMMLSILHHENLVKLIGYCADGAQRLLVYEYMSLGSLEDHLLGDTEIQRSKEVQRISGSTFEGRLSSKWLEPSSCCCCIMPSRRGSLSPLYGRRRHRTMRSCRHSLTVDHSPASRSNF